MARILVDGDWYEEVAPTAMYETDFERIVMGQAASLYPEYNPVPFKTLVYSETGVAKADMALVDREYREWWVVEIEMNHHSLMGHVLPQVRTLAQAAYHTKEVENDLCKQHSALDRRAVQDMLKGKQPRVLVIVNAPRPEWARELAPYGAYVAVFEVFRSDKNRHIFRVNGEHPKRLVGVISRCFFDKLIPRFLIVESPAALGISANERIQIRYQDRITEWERVDIQDKVFLNPISANPLQSKTTYELIRISDGSLEVRPHKG